MKKQQARFKDVLCAVLFSVPLLAVAQDLEPALKHGVYVRRPEACKGAPNAAIMSWNGATFSGPHSSKCTSRIVHKNGQRFEISTSCSAQGDGSPNPSGKPDVETLLLTRLSSTEFTILKDNQAQGTYRWCSVKEVE